MHTMAVTGMAADSPESPQTFPLLAASPAYDEEEEKNDYRADDEDEDEVDNSYDYIPENEFNVGSESSEDEGEPVSVKQVLLGTDRGDVEMETPNTDTSIVQEVDVERHTVIQDTTVVKEYAQVAERDAVEEKTTETNKLMAVTVTASSAVIDQQTSSTLGSAATGGGTSSNISSDDSQDCSSMEVELGSEAPNDVEFGGQDDESDGANEEEEQKTNEVDLSKESTEQFADVDIPMDEDPARKSPPSADIVSEDYGDKNNVPNQDQEKPQTAATSPGSPASPVSAKNTSNKSTPSKSSASTVTGPANTKSSPAKEYYQSIGQDEKIEVDEVVAETPQSTENNAAEAEPQQNPLQKNTTSPLEDSVLKPASAEDYTNNPTLYVTITETMMSGKRKHDESSPSEHPTPVLTDERDTCPKRQKKSTVAPTHTPKQSKRAASKKQKAPTTNDNSESLRRSSRIKHEPPKFTFPVKRLADETMMSHFQRKADNGPSSPATSRMVCKYCGKEMTTSRGAAKRHLKSCPAFTALQNGDGNANDEKTASPVHTPTQVQIIKSKVSMNEARDRMTLVQLMGSEVLASKVKGAFQDAPFVGHAPVSRFEELIRNDATGLRHLNVQTLLDAVDTKDGPVVQLRPKLPGARRSTGFDVLESVSKAKDSDLENRSLRFPAPRSVAEQFIVPLAKELSLEYAMCRHTAKLVSCPEEGTVLDWQFHRPETIVFQLRGKSLWRMKKSQMEYPLECFHPESWQLEEIARSAKVQRLASVDKASVGVLTPPGDGLDVFDENAKVVGVSDEVHENLLKPGSVLYLPNGVWFETETEDTNSLWLEVQLGSLNYLVLVSPALVQLGCSDKQWHVGVQLNPRNRNKMKQARHQVEACFKSLGKEMIELEGSDILPVYRATEDMQELVAQGLIHVVDQTPTLMSIAVDLTNPRFKMKHVKVFRDAEYLVNPVAALMSMDEIPYLPAHEREDQPVGDTRAASITQTQHRELKKTPKPKPKRKQALRVVTHTDKHTYVLDESFGYANYQSQLHVKFQCSAEQSRLVEWLRGRGSEPFDLDEFTHGDGTLQRQGKSSTRCEENARTLLRFLCFVGYVTQVKVP